MIAKFIWENKHQKTVGKTLKINISDKEQTLPDFKNTTKFLSLKQCGTGTGLNRQINGIEQQVHI